MNNSKNVLPETSSLNGALNLNEPKSKITYYNALVVRNEQHQVNAFSTNREQMKFNQTNNIR